MKITVALIAVTAALLSAAASVAGETGLKLEQPHYNFNRETLRRGADLFVQYCLTCHNLRYLRYSRVAEDLGLAKTQVKDTLMIPDGAEYVAPMLNTMDPDEAARWFGTAPPDLTLEARYRGTAWIYTYLKGFYLDQQSSSGWSNRLFPNVAMPNVLAPLGGVRDGRGNSVAAGSMNPQQFDRTVAALTAWLQYTSDPSRLERHALGPWVIGFLLIFTVLAYLLKWSYWRAVH